MRLYLVSFATAIYFAASKRYADGPPGGGGFSHGGAGEAPVDIGDFLRQQLIGEATNFR